MSAVVYISGEQGQTGRTTRFICGSRQGRCETHTTRTDNFAACVNGKYFRMYMRTMKVGYVPGDGNKRDPERENWPCRVMLPIQSISGSRLLPSPGTDNIAFWIILIYSFEKFALQIRRDEASCAPCSSTYFCSYPIRAHLLLAPEFYGHLSYAV